MMNSLYIENVIKIKCIDKLEIVYNKYTFFMSGFH